MKRLPRLSPHPAPACGASFAAPDRVELRAPKAFESIGEFKMKAVRGKSFVGQRVVLDGKSFVECHFKD
ncbi:MAG TPA: hypothetical protein VF193_16280, partial [Steroidobacter sp.]